MLKIVDIRTYRPPHFGLEDVMTAIADCIHPAFRKPTPKHVRDAVRARESRFRFPDETVAAYLQELCNAGELSGTGWGYELTDETQTWIEREQIRLRGIDRRRAQADRALDTILEALLPSETIAFDIATWRITAIGDPPTTPLASIETGDASWTMLDRHLTLIAAMADGGEEPVSVTLGLPIDAANHRAVMRRQARLDNETNERTDQIRRQARHALGAAAEAWLAATETDRSSPLILAGRDAAGLVQAQAALSAAVAARDRATRAAALANKLQDQLRREAAKRLQPKYVELFLTTTDPDFGCSPLSRCTDDQGYALALARLQQTAARQRRSR